MKKRFTPADLKYFHYLSWPAVSPDGSMVAYVDKVADEESGLFLPAVHVLDRKTRREIYVTPQGHQEMQPLFLKSGALACLSNASGEYQVWLNTLKGGARQITTLRHGVNNYRVSGSGDMVVFEATLWPEETEGGTAFCEMTPEEKAAWQEELDWRPYEATDLMYKLDEWYGMRKGEFSHIGVARMDGTCTQILPVGMEAVYPNWSHDGQRIAFYGYPYGGPRARAAELYVCAPDGSALTQLSEKTMLTADQVPIFTPNDEGILVLAYHFMAGGGYAMHPLSISPADKKTTWLMDGEDESVCEGVHELAISRTENGENDSYMFLTDGGRTLVFQAGFKGRNKLFALSTADPTSVRVYMEPQSDIQSFGMNEKGDLALLQGTLTEPAELYLDGEKVTHANAWLQDYAQGRVEERWITSKDGKAELQYFLLHPAFEEPGVCYPAVLDIKGGPTTMYGAAYWHEFHALSASGKAVIYGNPRGSVGFGRNFCAGGICWKQEIVDDLLCMCEDAVSLGFIDRSRIGVTGGSYGGYMTAKLIGLTDYFAAAVIQRGLINTATSYGTGDQGFISSGKPNPYFTMLKYLEDRARGNNISRVDSMHVPVLLLHAYKDFRCTFEQAEQLFIALKERHPEVPVRLVMFPEENHALTRTGRLHSQIRHLSEMVQWFDKYLEKKEGEQHE